MKSLTGSKNWRNIRLIAILIVASTMALAVSFTLLKSNHLLLPAMRDFSDRLFPSTGKQSSPGLLSARLNSTPTPGGTQTPATGSTYLPLITPIEVAGIRPYSSNSVWNTPIGDNSIYDPHSKDMIATIGLEGEGRITSDPNQYSYPVYYADVNTPRWDIPCVRYACTVVEQQQTLTTPVLHNVPIPYDARPSSGTDGQMIIIDRLTFTEYDLYEANHTATGWTVSNASTYNILWDGTPQRYGSRGAGVPYLAGLIQPWEIQEGTIEHALAFGYPEPAANRCVYPATKTDGKSNLPYAIPQGARLQLDPTLSGADFDRMGLSRTGKIIARALQKYGMVLIDTSGRSKIYVENLIDNPLSKVQWTDPKLNLNSGTIAGIPYTAFRVLKLPNGYWNTAQIKPNYGECYR